MINPITSTESMDEYPYITSTFEKLTFFWKKSVSIFWLGIATFALISSIIILLIFGEKLYLITQIIIVFNVYLWPILYIYFSKGFYKLWKNDLVPLFWEDKKIAYNWYVNVAKNAYIASGKRSLLITIPFISFAYLTIFFILDLPFINQALNIISLLGLVIMLPIAFLSLNIIFSTFLPLIEYSNFKPLLDYFTTGYGHFNCVKRYYTNAIWILIAINFSLFFGFFYSPYFENGKFPIILILWIVFISCWPTVVYFFVIVSLNRIESNLKKNTIDEYDKNILINKVNFTSSNDKLEQIKEALEFKKYLFEYRIDEKKLTNYLLALIPIISAIIQLWIAFIKK